MKKVIALLFSITIFLSVFTVKGSSLATSAEGDEVKFLNAIGVVQDFTNSDDFVKRADAAKMFVALYGISAEGGSENGIFSDVSDKDAPYVLSAYRIGIMKGYGDGSFKPENNLKLAEAVKIIISILGYTPKAEGMGGYPSGYLSQASVLGLFEGVSSVEDGPIKYGDLTKMIKNALEVNIMEKVTYGTGANETYMVNENQTILSRYLNINSYEGRVTGNYFTNLKDEQNIGKNEVAIDGRVLKMGDTNAGDLLGYRVKAYAKINDNNETLIYTETTKTKVVTADAYDISPKTTKDRLLFQDDNKGISIDSNAVMVKNSQVKADWTKEDLFTENGDITAIAPDGVNYDLIIVNSYKTLVVNRVNSEQEIIYTKNGAGTWGTLDLKNGFSKIRIEDAEGTQIDISKLNEWSVLSAAKSEDNSIIKILCGSKSVTGKISEASSDDIVIDSNNYKIVKDIDESYKQQLTVSAEGTYYLDCNGKIAAYSKVRGGKQYGYFISAEQGKGLDNTLKVKILLEDGKISVLEVEDTISDKLRNNAKLLNGDTVIDQLVYFSLNDIGKINYLETAMVTTAITPDSERFREFSLDYAAAPGEGLFCSGIKEKMFLGKWIANETIVFTVPDTPTGNDKDYGVSNTFAHGVTFKNLSFYDVDERNRITAAVMKGQTGASDVSAKESAGVGIVKDVVSSLNEEGEITTKLYVYNKSGVLEGLEVSDSEFPIKFSCMIYNVERMITSKNDPMYGKQEILLSDLDKGDVIMYEKSTISGKLVAARVVFRSKYPVKYETYFTVGASIAKDTNYTRLNAAYATVKAVVDDGIRVTAPLTPNSPDENERFYFYGKGAIYLFDTSKGTVKTIGAESITEGDNVLSIRQNMNQSLIVVYR